MQRSGTRARRFHQFFSTEFRLTLPVSLCEGQTRFSEFAHGPDDDTVRRVQWRCCQDRVVLRRRERRPFGPYPPRPYSTRRWVGGLTER